MSSLAPSDLTDCSTAVSADTPLPSPADLRASSGLSPSLASQIARHRDVVSACLGGADNRMLAVVGPCSVHNVEEALAFADRLAPLAARVAGELVVAMRVYIEKPRSTVGWRGLVYDPSLRGQDDLARGLAESRRAMLGVVARGLPVATESLDPLVVPYIDDLLAFTSVGARTSESQTHRQMAASMPCPVGLKNTTSGGLEIAADGAVSAATAQSVFTVSEEGRLVQRCVPGNPSTALILRGASTGPNFDVDTQSRARALLQARNLGGAVIVDCSHGNSGKEAARQLDVVRYLCEHIRKGAQCPSGVMLESNHEHGKQSIHSDPLLPGVSVTDECLGFSDTERALLQLAEAVRSARTSHQVELAALT